MAQPYKVIDKHDARAYTCALLELVDEGMLDRDQLIEDLVTWMSEYEVEQFCKQMLKDDDNECVIRDESEVEEDFED